MSIFGIFIRDAGRAAADEGLLRAAMHSRVPMRFADGPVLLSSLRPIGPGGDGPRTLVSGGRIHNRAELALELGFAGRSPSDQTLFEAAHARWHRRACEHVHGDWSYAAWDARDRTLTLARDRFGNTSLYYYADAGVFAFATSLHDLLALRLAPIAMDELYLAQTLISWPGFHGARTIHAPMRRLPPAHVACVTPDRLSVERYWRLEEVSERRLPRRMDYVERFNELFEQAVRQRLPDGVAVATTLSGGLDSGSVSVVAAAALRERGERLIAYTSIPVADTTAYTGRQFGDEYPFAAATAAAGGIDLRPIDAAAVSPIATLREMLDITLHPEHAAGNVFWLLELYRTAAREGAGMLLTGQMGNAGISWAGSAGAWPLRRQIAREGLAGFGKRRMRQALPRSLERAYRRLRHSTHFPDAAIAPDFAARLELTRRQAEDDRSAPYLDGRQARLALLLPGASVSGAGHAQLGAAAGIEIADPTADARLLEFCLSIPDAVFVDPRSGTDRWLIREAMRGRLPDEVRCNRAIGQQAGDLVPRLRAHADEVEAALDEIGRGPAAGYVDVPMLRTAWRVVQAEDSIGSFGLAMKVLTRGIMAGLFVNTVGASTGGQRN